MGRILAKVRSTVALAVITLTPVGRLTLAEAVDAAVLPASGVLETVLAAESVGVSVTCTTVPTGTFDPSSATVTGFACEEGTTTSGTPWNDPTGEAGAATPATEAMRNCGPVGSVTGLGAAKLIAAGATFGVKLP